MSRKERRQIKRDRQKNFVKQVRQKAFAKESYYERPPIGARIFIIAASLTIVFLFLYLALRDNSLPDDELSTIYVTLKEAPEYDHYKVKTTRYRSIILSTVEFQSKFKIGGMEYEATDHDAFKANIVAGDKVALKVRKSDIDNLDENTFWNNHNAVYGLSKNGISYIDIERSMEFTDRDSKWAYIFVMFGLVMLPYGFINGKPLISLNKALIATVVTGFIIMLIVSRL